MAIIAEFSHVAAYINTLKLVFQKILKNDWFNKKKLLRTFIKLYKTCIFPKVEVSSFKIGRFIWV